MTGQSPRSDKQSLVGNSGEGGSPRWATILLALVAILLTTFLAIRFVGLPGSSTDDDTPVLLAETGCFDMDLLPADHEPPMAVDQVEADVRAGVTEIESVSGSAPDDPDELGDRIWADYGELGPGTAGRDLSGHAWVLVFDFEQDASWWSRLTIQDEDHRFSVIYRPDTREIVAACSDQA